MTCRGRVIVVVNTWTEGSDIDIIRGLVKGQTNEPTLGHDRLALKCIGRRGVARRDAAVALYEMRQKSLLSVVVARCSSIVAAELS